MTIDRITKLRVRGLRSIEDAELSLTGLTTLIGDNGSGKSCFIEAAEMLRHAAKRVEFVTDIIDRRHGGLRSLLRRGASELSIGVTIEGAGPPVDYDMTVAQVGPYTRVVRETLDIHEREGVDEPRRLMLRQGGETFVFRDNEQEGLKANLGDRQACSLPWLDAEPHPAFGRALGALDRIAVHVPFETRALWQHVDLGITTGARWPSMFEHTQLLSRYGVNLPNVFQVLRNRGGEVWRRVVDRARLGLGGDLRDFSLSPARRGEMELEVVFGSLPGAPVPVEALSDGQVAYLCFIALCEFHESRSLLLFDEPEGHLHPLLVARVALMLEDAAAEAPILVATHSNQFLDALSSPVESVRLCVLDKHRATQVQELNAATFQEWLEDYVGLGSIREAGYERHVFVGGGAAG